jgi:2-polyprenyl-3-methyl-5-hydroxy-6-metoxy-1,4-benzoquinol methylase
MTRGAQDAWSLLDLFRMGEAALALVAAERTGLLGALLDRDPPGTDAELAAELGLDPRATRLTLDVLVLFGVATRTGEIVRASGALHEMRRSSPGGVHTDLQLLGHVEEFLRTGRPLVAMDGSLAERGERYAAVVPGLAAAYRPAAAELAALLLPGPAVLDLGAGAGVWGLALAVRDPAVRLTAVDLPPVLGVLQVAAREAGVAGRVRTVPGSYFDVELAAGAYDVVLLGNVLHLERPAGAARLVERAAAALRPGGTLAVVDILSAGEHPTDRDRAMYALFLGLRAEHGRMYRYADLAGWLAAAGLDPGRPVPLPSAPRLLDVVVAGKPGGPA